MRLIALAAAASASLSIANAASLINVTGEVWNGTATLNNLGDADTLIASDVADATWDVSAIDYANGDSANSISSNSSLSNFLGVDAASLTGTNLPDLNNTAFRFTGMINIDAGDNTWSVGSDDGFRLKIGGNVIGSFNGTRGFRTSSGSLSLTPGLYTFELVFFERTGRTGVEFKTNDLISEASAVPVPGAALLMGGVLAAGVARKRRAGKA